MKIAHLSWTFQLGGISTMLAKLNPGIKVVFLHRKVHSLSPLFILKCNQVLKHLNPDVIHLHNSCLYGLIFSRKLSRGVCTTLHALPKGSVRRGGFFSRLFPILNVFSKSNVGYIDRIRCVFAISEAVKEALQKNYGVKSLVINNGIPTSVFQLRATLANNQPLRVVQIGRLVYDKKGQDLLIEAIARMRGSFTVDFIGWGENRGYLESLVEKLNLKEYVHFLGKQTQSYISEHLCKYDLLVQPSRYEGFGLTVAEAMAAQVPVLVSEGQGPAEVTQGETYGWTFKNGDVDDLVKKLSYIKTHYQEALTKAQQARKYVMATYDVSVTAQKYLEEYEKNIEKKSLNH